MWSVPTFLITVVACPALTLGSATVTMAAEPPITAQEMAILRTFALGDLPPDPSNRRADDPQAAALGQKFYFDTRFSGPLGPDNDGLTNGSLGKPGQWNKVSCASCHDPAHAAAITVPPPPASPPADGPQLPSVLNAAYSPVWQF
jgi:cytochrome c peroxidase